MAGIRALARVARGSAQRAERLGVGLDEPVGRLQLGEQLQLVRRYRNLLRRRLWLLLLGRRTVGFGPHGFGRHGREGAAIGGLTGRQTAQRVVAGAR